MKFNNFKRFFPLLTLATVVTLCGCNKSHDEENQSKNAVLTMGTSADMPPFEFFRTGEGGPHITGFDVEVAQALGKELGLEVRIKDMDFSALIPALQAGRVDFVMASMTPTPERRKNVDFSDAYLRLPVAVISKEGVTITKTDHMKNKRVGVQFGSTHEQMLKELVKRDSSIKVASLNKLGELVQELQAGRVDGVLMETSAANSYVKSHPGLVSNELKSQKVDFSIAFPKGSAWREKFNSALDKDSMQKKIDELRKKWIDSK